MLRAEQEAGPGWRKFFKNGMWKRTMAGMSVQAWQVGRIKFTTKEDRSNLANSLVLTATGWSERHCILSHLHR
jgi:hypothetical protein